MKRTLLLFTALIMSASFAFAAKTIPASNNVPGVHVWSLLAGDSWSGANIILGNDATGWPYSTTDDGIVAFTPVKDATYHMTINLTSTGATDLRVRWINGNANGGYTAADAAAPSVNVYPADAASVLIPAYFQNTVTNGDSQTYSFDFLMDGTQSADGLVGNIALRGAPSGSNDYYINTIVITDADGNMLVNYDKDAAAAVTSFNFENNAIGDTYGAYSIDGTTGEAVLMDVPATVVANPAATDDNAQSLSYTVTGYDQVILLGTVVVPAGLTLADCSGVSFDAYTDAPQYKEILMKISDEPLWGNGIYKKVCAGGSWANLSVNLTTGETTDADGNVTAKDGSKGGTSVYTDGSLTSFDFYLALNDNALSYYLDNVVFNFQTGSGIIQVKPEKSSVCNTVGGVIVNGNNENVTVFGIDGRLVKQTIANQGTFIPLQQGLYIVKVGTKGAVKVLVK